MLIYTLYFNLFLAFSAVIIQTNSHRQSIMLGSCHRVLVAVNFPSCLGSTLKEHPTDLLIMEVSLLSLVPLVLLPFTLCYCSNQQDTTSKCV